MYPPIFNYKRPSANELGHQFNTDGQIQNGSDFETLISGTGAEDNQQFQNATKRQVLNTPGFSTINVDRDESQSFSDGLHNDSFHQMDSRLQAFNAQNIGLRGKNNKNFDSWKVTIDASSEEFSRWQR